MRNMTEHDPTLPRTAAVLIILVTLAVAGSGHAQRDQYPWRDMGQTTFDVADGGTLRVRVDDADVALLDAEAGRVDVTFRLRSNDMDWAVDRFERTHYRARVDGDTVVIESDDEPRGSWISGNWMSVLVEVRLPTRFHLDVATQDGDVSAGSFLGDATLRSQDGDLTIESLDGDTIDLHSQDGDVRASLLAGASVSARSQDGDIEVGALRGAASMHTQDGDIHIGAADAPELELSTGDGDIWVGIDHDARMELQTRDGDISIDAPATLRADIDLRGEDVYIRGIGDLNGSVSDRRAQGTVNGGGDSIRARTSDGTVRLIGR